MNLHEYQAKDILRGYGIPIPPGEVVNDPERAEQVAKQYGGTVVVKAQVHAGGRGKAGGVKYCPTPKDAREKASGLATAFGGALGPVYSINSVRSGSDDGYGGTTLDRVEVTGSRIQRSSYLQPTVEYMERVSAVFELKR